MTRVMLNAPSQNKNTPMLAEIPAEAPASGEIPKLPGELPADKPAPLHAAGALPKSRSFLRCCIRPAFAIAAVSLAGCAAGPNTTRTPNPETLPHPPNHDYYGGRGEWYDAGVALGRSDRKQRLSSDYTRHAARYGIRTESEFANGYEAGYQNR